MSHGVCFYTVRLLLQSPTKCPALLWQYYSKKVIVVEKVCGPVHRSGPFYSILLYSKKQFDF